MRTISTAAVVMLVLVCAVCFGAPPTSITNYFTGAVIIDNTITNVGDTGLATSNAYVCIPTDVITNSEYTLLLVTNDVRPFISSMIKRLDDAIDAQDSTNQFSTFVVNEDVSYPSATNRTVFRSISEQQTITIVPGYPTE